jgi:C-terminal processing protease CtpA/Prc
MKCSYPNHLKATDLRATLMASPISPKRMLRVAGIALALSCGTSWTGSVGTVLGKNVHDGRLYVRDAPPDMTAAKAGVHVGDELVAIDGKPCRSMSATQVHEALSGAVGSKVKLTVERDGQALTFDVERGPLRGE